MGGAVTCEQSPEHVTPQPHSWRSWLADPRLRIVAAVTLVCLCGVVVLLGNVLVSIESRKGVVLPDPLLASFAARDVSIPIFALIYGSIVLWVIHNWRSPERLLVTAVAYVVMILIRIVAMYLAPFEPPPDIIPLVDHLAETFGPAQRLTRDLFFSGHTSTIFLLALTSATRWRRIGFGVSALGVGALVLLQHVHYSIDVLVAPMAALASLAITLFVWRGAGLPMPIRGE